MRPNLPGMARCLVRVITRPVILAALIIFFSILMAGGTPYAASATATDTPTATPTATDTATATSTATTTPTSTATTSDTATPTATSTPKPKPIKLTVSAASLNFKSVKTGSALTKSVTLKNKSNVGDELSNLQVTGQYFSLASDGCAGAVPPDGKCQYGVSFAPLTKGKFKGELMFTDLSKNSSHKVKLTGKSVATPTPVSTATPTASATPTLIPTPTATSTGATPTATSTGATATPTITPSATGTGATPTPSSTPTAGVASISENASAFVYLNNPNRSSATPAQTSQATAVSTASFSTNLNVSDENVDMSGNAQSTQTSSIAGSTISVDATATASSDVSACSGQAAPCIEGNQGFTEFDTDVCLASAATYTISGTLQASAALDSDQIYAVAALLVTNELGEPATSYVNEQAFDDVTDQISMNVALPAGCFDFNVQVFAVADGSNTGSANASCSVEFSPQ
jgi:hypothetical protein